MREVRFTGERVIGFHAIDQHEDMIGLGAARPDLGQRAGSTGMRDCQARNGPQDIGCKDRASGLDIAGIEPGNTGRRIIGRNRHAGGSDQDDIIVLRVLGQDSG